jgi:exosortase
MAAPEAGSPPRIAAHSLSSPSMPGPRSVARIPMVYLLLALALLAMWPSVSTLCRYWWSVYDYHHGFVVAGLCVWWFAEQRTAKEFSDPRVSRWQVLALPPVLFAWLVAAKGHSALAQQLLLPLVLSAVVFAVTGAAGVRRASPPLFYLYFAVPVWDYLVPVLQRATIAVIGGVLGILRIPAVVNDTIVSLPTGRFEIIEGCAGKRYFVIALTIAYAASLMQRMTWPRRLLLLAATAALTIFANWIRVLIVIAAGYATNMRHYFVAVEHQSLGWVIFAILVVAIVLLAGRLSHTGPPAPAPAAGTAPVAVPMRSAWAVTALLLVGTAIWARHDPTDLRAGRLGALPLLADRWQGPLPPEGAWRPRFIGAADTVRAAYASDRGWVEVYANTYGPERPGAKLVYFENTLLAPNGWVEASRPPPFKVIRDLFSSGPASLDARLADGELWTISYVYRVGARSASSPLAEQMISGLERLTGNPATGIVAFATRCGGDCLAARTVLADFWAGPAPSVVRMLPERLASQALPVPSSGGH